MKAILVIDMPKDCGDCKLIDCVNYDNTRARCKAMVYAKNEYSKFIGINDKPDWCPLKPMPTMNKLEEVNYLPVDWNYFNLGWNSCIKTILGEEE